MNRCDCGALLRPHDPQNERARPEPGDLTLCAQCGRTLIYELVALEDGPVLVRRMLSDAELERLPTYLRVQLEAMR